MFPGSAVDGLVLPLNVDAYLLHTAANPNAPPLAGSFGQLDGAGQASATFSLAAGLPSVANTTIHHAFLVFDAGGQVAFASNAMPLHLYVWP